MKRVLLQLQHWRGNGCSYYAALGSRTEHCRCGRWRWRPDAEVEADLRTMRWLEGKN